MLLPKWKKSGLIFSQNSNGFFRSHVTRPIPVLINNNTLRIYFSSRDVNNIPFPTFIDVSPDNPNEILRVCHKPMMQLGRTGCFDDSGITPVSIVECDDGDSLMYYVGWKRRRYGVTIETAIGVAKLNHELESLERIYEGPILAQDKFHPILVAAPFVVRAGNVYRMWYCSAKEWKIAKHGPEMIYTVFYAESKDGINWTGFSKNPIIDYAYDGEVVSAPWVIKTKDGYLMWYSHRGFESEIEKQYSPGLAYSEDGLNWNRIDENVGIAKSKFGWDSEMICYPAVINYINKSYMFYSGNNVGKGGLGFATAENMIQICSW